jgi:integrase/recombinase XerD
VPSKWKVETYTEDEIGQLLAACNDFGTPFCVQRNRAILALLLDSGMRAGELLSLLVNDVDPRQGMFTVRGKGDKTRPVVVGSFARRELWAYLTLFRLKMDVEVTTDALFISYTGTPFTYDGLMRMFRKLKAKSGIDRVSVRPHMCRHTFATIAHRNGMRGATLQEALGHTTFDITRRYYLDVSKEDLVEEHARYGPLDHLRQEAKVASKARSPKKPVNHDAVRAKIPNPATLLDEVQHYGYRATGHKYGVSDNAIRGRLKRAGLI